MVDPSLSRLGLVRRTRPRQASGDDSRALGRFVRLESWNGLESGDVVRVAGHAARGRHWRFRAHVTNTSNGASWVEVSLVEGPAPRRPESTARSLLTDEEEERRRREEQGRVERVRSFAPELVSARWRRRPRRSRVLSPPPAPPDQPSLF